MVQPGSNTRLQPLFRHLQNCGLFKQTTFSVADDFSQHNLFENPSLCSACLLLNLQGEIPPPTPHPRPMLFHASLHCPSPGEAELCQQPTHQWSATIHRQHRRNKGVAMSRIQQGSPEIVRLLLTKPIANHPHSLLLKVNFSKGRSGEAGRREGRDSKIRFFSNSIQLPKDGLKY